ncbi:MAG: pitrilysin family protein [Planctomycetota bacterium]
MQSTPIESAGCVVHETRLANGLRVLVIERHTDPVVASMCWYKVGSKSERTEEAGLSHFLEHMMFKGTERFGKGMVDREITRLGGSNNAYTSYDYTAYWFELASDRWERALDLEADRMRGLLLDPAEFESEKAVVLEELSMGLDDPWRRLGQELGPLQWGRHPYSRPIIGYRDVLERMTPGRMRDFYQRYYHPGNATVVVSGDVDPSAALDAIEARYGSIPAGPAWEQCDPWRPEIEVPAGPRRVQLEWG